MIEQKREQAKKPREKNTVGFLLIAGLIFILFTGVFIFLSLNNRHIPNLPIIDESKNEGNVKKFEDYNQMKDFLSEIAATNSNNYYGSNFTGGMQKFAARTDTMMGVESTSEIGTLGAGAKPSGVPMANDSSMRTDEYSTTNVQVAGVDEGDIVKTDGDYIYTVVGNEVVIVDATPPQNMSEVSRIKLDSVPSGIYLNGNKLAVYGTDYTSAVSKYKDIIPQNRYNNYTYLKVFDISDRKNPQEKRSFNLEGNLSNSRMIGDYVYFVTANQQYYYDEKFPVPIVFENGEVLSSDKTALNCNCPDVFYFDIPYQSSNLTSVSSLNIMDDSSKLNSEVYILDGYQNNLFVSESNIYVTYNKRVNEEELTMDITMELIREYIYPSLNATDREKVEKIEQTENYILSPTEKFSKIEMILTRYGNALDGMEEELSKELEKRVQEKFVDISKELEKTVIHKIQIDNGNLQYKTAGEVTGVVLNQFSMDENEGYFRIATTRSRDWSSFKRESSNSYSNLFILDADMKVVGKVENLAEGERIYSVRFMQNRAYMVTFKQTDPLFVIGLEDPTNPKVLGELKVPGFSSYLHPYDETTLIGLGKESDSEGRIVGGVKLSLFDVSDVTNPKEIDKYVLGDRNSNSIAINEHKAFLFSKERNLLVIPVTMQEGDMVIQEVDNFSEMDMMRIMPPTQPIKIKYFSGAAVFNISEKGFELKGKIDHSDESSNSYYGSNNVNRSLYIGDALYTLSNQYLKANWLDTLNEAKSLKLGDGQNSIEGMGTSVTPSVIWE